MTNSFAIPWTVAFQAPLSVEFPRQEYWSGFSFPSPGDLLNPGIKPTSPALDSLPSEPPGKPQCARLFAHEKMRSHFFYKSTNPTELSNNLVELIIFIPLYGGRNWQWEFKEISKGQGLSLVGRWSKQERTQSETHAWDQRMLLMAAVTHLRDAITIFKMHNHQGPTVEPREICSLFCNNLNGKRAWERIDICRCTTESLCCTN